jgi:UDP-galactopyranose mutase
MGTRTLYLNRSVCLIKHATGQRHHKTTIVREYPLKQGDPYYPIPTEENLLLYERYQNEASKLKSVL